MQYINRALADGSEVLVFDKADEGKFEYKDHVIKGIIKRQTYPTDLYIHGSPTSFITYEVLGEDGRMYYGNYGHSFVSNNLFLTKNDYIEYLNNKLVFNKAKIIEIEIENSNIINLIETMQNDKNNSKIR